jgi:hypothetical protein
VVLSEKTAKKLFGQKNPTGETIKIEKEMYSICGVVFVGFTSGFYPVIYMSSFKAAGRPI